MSSKRGVRRRVCGKKVKYATEANAKRAAHILSRKTGEWFRPYICWNCRQWHVGHPPSDIQRKMVERLVGRA